MIKFFFISILISFILFGCSSSNNQSITDRKAAFHTNQTPKATLDYPYGTMVELKVQIIDGEGLQIHKYQGKYLLKLLEVNNKKVQKNLIFEFENKALDFDLPRNNFELYEFLFGEETGRISHDQILEMKKKYVGKIYKIAAFESAKSFGKPYDSYKYSLFPTQYNFHFINYLVVISNLN